MKRVVGRKIMNNQVADYSQTVEIPAVDPDQIDIKNALFRFRWASDIMDNNIQRGFYYRRFLDVGAYDGRLSVIAAKKKIGRDATETTIADAVEAHKRSYDAAAQTASIMYRKGFHMNAYNVAFEDYKTDNVYDMICAFEFLEHTKDPFFCVEKMYDLLQIGGDLLITVPEEHGQFGLDDRNPYHYFTSTIQSLISVLFYDDRKWRIQSVFVESDLIHAHVKKTTYMV